MTELTRTLAHQHGAPELTPTNTSDSSPEGGHDDGTGLKLRKNMGVLVFFKAAKTSSVYYCRLSLWSTPATLFSALVQEQVGSIS